MKKTLILAAAILAASALHARADTASPTVLQSGRARVAHGHLCGEEPTTSIPAFSAAGPSFNDYTVFATSRGNVGEYVVHAEILAPSASHPQEVHVCLNVPAVSPATGPVWVSYVVIGTPPSA